jgi:hypothetical protein
VRATLGALTTDFLIHCEPLRELRGERLKYVLLGDTTQLLHIGGVGLDGRPIARLAADLRLLDGRVATLAGARIVPRRAGRTLVVAEAGGQRMEIPLTVLERARTLAVLPHDGHAVAMPVRLAPGEVVRWPVAAGHLWLEYVPGSPTASVVRIDVNAAPCWREPALVPGAEARLECIVGKPGAAVSLVATGGPAAGLLVLRPAP